MEHWCKDCKNDGDNVCKFTGAVHTTGIECPSFDMKEIGMSKFKIADKVRVLADKKRLKECSIDSPSSSLTGHIGVVVNYYDESAPDGLPYRIKIDDKIWCMAGQDLELVNESVKLGPQPVPTVAEHTARTFIGHPDGVLEVKSNSDTIIGRPEAEAVLRTFGSGATRDTDQGKLDYLKALSPVVIRRYVQYLDKHRLQPDGSYRGFDNWKKGVPQEVYHSSGGRHFFDTWLLTEGYATEDNHGPIELEDVICAQLFNLMGRLHEILKVKELRALPSRMAPTKEECDNFGCDKPDHPCPECKPDRTAPVKRGLHGYCFDCEKKIAEAKHGDCVPVCGKCMPFSHFMVNKEKDRTAPTKGGY